MKRITTGNKQENEKMSRRANKAFIALLETVLKRDGRTLTLLTDEFDENGRQVLEIDEFMFNSWGLDKPSIFHSCTDEEATILLQKFIQKDDDHVCFRWGLSCQLSRLLADKGHLCKDQVEAIIRSTDWKQCTVNLLYLSYVVNMDDRVPLLLRLLDEVEFFRDGLFLALLLSDETVLHDSLIQHFIQWDSSGTAWSPGSTGELEWLGEFVKKWLNIYPFHQLEQVIRVFFNHPY